MNEEQYLSLCEACDRVLLTPDSTIERVAIPWLHVIREHPVFLANYLDLFERPKSVRSLWRHCLRLFRNHFVWLRQIGRALRGTGQLWFGLRELPHEIDVLFISHLLNATHAGQTDDFYFGELPNQLVAQGKSVAIALINYSGQPGANLVAKWGPGTVPRLIFSRSLGISGEFSLHRRLKKESLKLKRLANQLSAGLSRKVLERASNEALSGSARTTLRMAEQISGLVAKLRPKTVIVTHEGHAWERVTFATARNAFPAVRCIGYQHAAMFRLQHAIRRILSPEYNPDQILTAGTVSKMQLECASGLEGIPVSVLGSHRSVNPIKNNRDCVSDQKQVGHLDNSACLVLPEGVASECHLLFEFSLACAQEFSEIQFIWRLHPLMTYESLAAQDRKLRNLPSNVVLSQETLEEDIARSRWTLYRGSTAVVPAVVAGLRPIYLELQGELIIDPLYELGAWRMKVSTVAELKEVFRPDVDTCNGFTEADLDLARKYCESFFLPSEIGILLASIA